MEFFIPFNQSHTKEETILVCEKKAKRKKKKKGQEYTF